MANQLFTEQEPVMLACIREGMEVYDRKAEQIGARERMHFGSGFVRVDAAGRVASRYITPDQIAAADGDRVAFGVERHAFAGQ
jgi:hypothetical protein